MLMEISDDVIWIKHLKPHPSLFERLSRLKAEETILLSVDGHVGYWARMKDGKDGRPTMGVKPVGAMADIWKRYQDRRGERIEIDLPGDEDPFLRLADETFSEWYSAEDEEAFSDLRPI
jgi:hypothetical protein